LKSRTFAPRCCETKWQFIYFVKNFADKLNMKITLAFLILALGFLPACSSTEYGGGESDYETNTFFMGQGTPPSRSPSSEKFYNQVCERAGNNPYSGNSYTCTFDY
jgi:hypothetical protein